MSFCAYSRAYVDVQADRWSAGNLSAVYVVSHCRINILRWLFSKKRVSFGLSVHTVGHIYVYKQNRRTFQPVYSVELAQVCPEIRVYVLACARALQLDS